MPKMKKEGKKNKNCDNRSVAAFLVVSLAAGPWSLVVVVVVVVVALACWPLLVYAEAKTIIARNREDANSNASEQTQKREL